VLYFGNDASNNSSVVACVFVTVVTFLLSRCLATLRVLLPSRYLATIGEYTNLIRLLLFFQNKENGLKSYARPPPNVEVVLFASHQTACNGVFLWCDMIRRNKKEKIERERRKERFDVF
jgi:hypothetical protein